MKYSFYITINIMKLIIIIILIATIIGLTKSVFITKEVKGSTQFCVSQDIPKHTLVRIGIKKGDGQFSVKIYELNVLISQTQLVQWVENKSFTTQKHGIHKFCFTNKLQTIRKIAFDIAIGKKAGDFGSHTNHKDYIQTLKDQSKMAEQFMKEIVKENTEGLEIIVSETSDSYDFTCLYAFSSFFVVASVTLTYLQYKMIKKHLHQRKYI